MKLHKLLSQALEEGGGVGWMGVSDVRPGSTDGGERWKRW